MLIFFQLLILKVNSDCLISKSADGFYPIKLGFFAVQNLYFFKNIFALILNFYKLRHHCNCPFWNYFISLTIHLGIWSSSNRQKNYWLDVVDVAIPPGKCLRNTLLLHTSSFHAHSASVSLSIRWPTIWQPISQ